MKSGAGRMRAGMSCPAAAITGAGASAAQQKTSKRKGVGGGAGGDVGSAKTGPALPKKQKR